MVPLFRVIWAKNVEKEERDDVTMSLPEAQPAGAEGVKGIAAKYEPWVSLRTCHNAST